MRLAHNQHPVYDDPMRRSSHVIAPLLACASAATLLGCAHSSDCASTPNQPCTSTTQQSHKSIFGGFGSSFAEHSDDIIAFAVAGGVIIAMKALGS